MPITQYMPAAPEEVCSLIVEKRREIVKWYERCVEQYDADYLGAENSPTRQSLMLEAAQKMTSIPYSLGRTSDKVAIQWLFDCEKFWRIPAHTQALQARVWELEAELKKHTDFSAWLKLHLLGDKFKQDPTIQVMDLLHAMGQAGV
jgi:hypothetical protein